MTKLKNKGDLPIIVTTANNKYALPLTVLLLSIQNNLPIGSAVRVYILYRDMSPFLRDEISKCFTDKKIIVEWVLINQDNLSGLKLNGHITIDTYYRLLIEELFTDFQKVIYLDADLIVNRNICDLWHSDLKGNHLLAVPHASKLSGFVSGERGIPSYKLVGLPANTRTFNAGVMVLDLVLWRKDSISAQVLKYLREFKHYVLWWDQDGLNVILSNKWAPLSAEWNCMTCHLAMFSTYRDSLLTFEEYHKVLTSPAIIHYAGPSKPWLTSYSGPFENIFLQYVRSIPSNYIKRMFKKQELIAYGTT